MNRATSHFSFDIHKHVMHLHRPGAGLFITGIDNSNVPILYNKYGKRLVQNYFQNNKDSIETFCANILWDVRKVNKVTLTSRVEKLIEVSRYYDQGIETFYYLCIKLILLGRVAHEKGNVDSIIFITDRITILADEAYARGDLDEKFDSIHNFACDLLLKVLLYCGCMVELYWDLKKLVLDSNEFDYFQKHALYIHNFVHKYGNYIQYKFNRDLNVGQMTRELFMFQIQEFSDEFYGQIDDPHISFSLKNVLDILINISLFTLHAVELHYPCSIRIAHETIVKLAIVAQKRGLLMQDTPEIDNNILNML